MKRKEDEQDIVSYSDVHWHRELFTTEETSLIDLFQHWLLRNTIQEFF